MFLRADRFDAEKAAKRFTLWLDWKLKLFGQERLCQWHIGLDDLDDDARWTVKSGFFQMLPERDSRGRLIISAASNYRSRVHRSTFSFLQMAFYFALRFVEEEANQESGVVLVCYCLGPPAKELDDRHSTWEASKLSLCTPTRLEAIHYCTSTRMQYTSGTWSKGLVYSIGHAFGSILERTWNATMPCNVLACPVNYCHLRPRVS
jgi:hypothetical protein